MACSSLQYQSHHVYHKFKLIMSTRGRTLLKAIILGYSGYLLLGNKIDVDGGTSRVVSEKKAKAWCASKGNIPYFETSAKEGFNVEATFHCMAKNALENEPEEEIYLDTIDVNARRPQRASGCDC